MTIFSPEEIEKGMAVLYSVREKWLAREGVTAVDLGFKWSSGLMTSTLAIRVHVAKKLSVLELTEEDLFPKEIEGIPVDVIEAEYGLQLLPGQSQLEAAPEARKARYDPIPLGVSVGNPRITAGTLGAKVYDAANLELMVLSNWHVFVGSPSAALGEPIWQPGSLDGGKVTDTFATLSRSVLGPYDAAVAQLTNSREVMSETVDGDVIEDVIASQLGMMVWKSGRTTERTEGFIDGIKMITSINYGAAGIRVIQDVVRIVPRPGADSNAEISMGGDSGSIWVDEASGKGVGLHFAGEVGSAPEHALANELQPVLDMLNVLMPAQRPSEPDPIEPPPPSDDDFPQPPQPNLLQRIWQGIRNFGTYPGDTTSIPATFPTLKIPSNIATRLRLDVAVPQWVKPGRSFELAVAIKQLGSPLLVEIDLTKVESGEVLVEWPEDARIISLRIQVNAPDCRIETPEKNIRLRRDQNMSPIYFQLTPQVKGLINIHVSVFQEDVLLGNARIKTVVKNEVGHVKIEISSHLLNKDLNQLHKQMVGYFNRSELNELCFKLRIDREEFSYKKSMFVIELIEYCIRWDKLNDLIDLCYKERPNILWDIKDDDSRQSE